MPIKKDQDSTPGMKLLRLFRKLMLDGRRHYQGELAEELQCSPQTIIRLTSEIESIIGISLESGLDNRRRWYRIRTNPRSSLGMEFEELRYLSVCRDLAAPILPDQIRQRVDNTIFNLSVVMAERGSGQANPRQQQFAFFSKGKIDYTPHFATIEKLLQSTQERRVCIVRYRASGKAQEREHHFAPARMISMNHALYVVGALLSEDSTDVRHFMNLAIHRIQHTVLTDKKFTVNFPDITEDTFGLPWHVPRTFRIRFRPGKAADYVRERIWADAQKIEEQDDGGVILQLTTCGEPELMAWVRSFGEEAVLVGGGEFFTLRLLLLNIQSPFFAIAAHCVLH